LTAQGSVDAFSGCATLAHGAHQLFDGFDGGAGGEGLWHWCLAGVRIGFQVRSGEGHAEGGGIGGGDFTHSQQDGVETLGELREGDVAAEFDSGLEGDAQAGQ